MFSKSEEYYDEIYEAMGKDYTAESNKAHKFIQRHKRSKGNTLLDVGCGTGTHAGLLGRHYKVEGLDLDPKMLSVARSKYPKLRFHCGDMTNFDLGRQFDVVICLFGSIGYMRTKTNLRKAVRAMSRHLLPGGVLLIEPWFSPDQWNFRRVSVIHVEKPDLKIIRMSYGGRKGNISQLRFHYLIGTPQGIEHRIENHEMGLFTSREYLEAFSASGLDVTHDVKGVDGRGLYIGRKPFPG